MEGRILNVWGYVVFIALLVGLLGTGLWKYNNMVTTIENQAVVISNREATITTLNSNIEGLKESHDRELAKLKAEVSIAAKKEVLEKETDYDKNNVSRNIDSTYIDLP